MNVMVYASLTEYNEFVFLISEIPELQYRMVETTHVDNYDGLLADLKINEYDLIFING